MKTYYEEVISNPNLSQNIRDELRNAFIVKADNIAEYLWVNEKSSKNLTVADFPNIAPPFKNMFIEWNMPLGERFEFKVQMEALLNKKINLSEIDLRCGCLLIAEDYKGDEIRWKVRMIPLYPYEDDILKGEELNYSIMHDGRISTKNEMSDLFGHVDIERDNIDDDWLKADRFDYEIHVCFFTIALMHCKNVEIIPKKPSGLGERKRRNRYSSRILHHWLNIDPMKKILRTEGESEKRGLKYALHICRGHFKHFGGDNKKLFGKYEGDYWWTEQVRGKVVAGVIGKDYQIKLDNHGADEMLTDGFGNWWGRKCHRCGAEMVVIRPGEARCSEECYLRDEEE